MRTRTRPLLAAVLAAATGLVGVGVPVDQANAAGTGDGTSLGLDSFHTLVADDEGGHLFLSQGAGNNGVLVTDLEGNAVTTIPDQPGASGMALSHDGTVLYVGLGHADAISVIDTETLKEVDRYDTGATTCPGQVETTDTHVWFGYGCDQWDRSLGSIDLGASPPTVRTGLAQTFYNSPLLSVGADRLALGTAGISPSSVTTFDVSTGDPVQLAHKRGVGGNLQDLVVTPDGEQVVTASEAPSHHPVWRTEDLSADGVYPSDSHPSAVTTSEDGSMVAVGTADTNDVRVYRRGGSAPVKKYHFGSGVGEGGLTFSSDGSRLYVVTTDTHNENPTLHALEDPSVADVTLTATAPTRTDLGADVTVQGKLGFSGESGTGPQDLAVQRTDQDGTTQLDGVTTAAGGAYSFTDTIDAYGSTQYEVTYAGDALHESATATATPTVGADGGDMDADGDAELLAGAFRENIGSTRRAGMAMVLNGDPAGLTADGARAFSQKADGIPGAPEGYDLFGSATASGDFDGDGFADAVVTAPAEDLRGNVNVGLVSVTPGSADGPVVSESRPLSPIHLDRVVAHTRFGQGVATGDFDGDGFDDLAVGTGGEDWVAVYPGSEDGLVRARARFWSQQSSGVPGVNPQDPYTDLFGFAVATGDANGDGFDDLAVGAPWDAEDRGWSSGAVTMLYGGAEGLTADGAQRWSRDSAGIKNRPRRFGSDGDESDDFGRQVELADHDGDGYADLAAGAPGTPRWVDGDRRRDAGSVSVLFGSADGITNRDVTIAQDKPGVPGIPGDEDVLGLTLATGQTGDGAADLAVAAVGERTVTVLRGSANGFVDDGVTRYGQDTPGVPGKDEREDHFGDSLRLADYDGDGHDDLAVGAPGENRRRGAVTVLYTDGGPGLTTTSTWMSQATPGVPGKAEVWDWFGTFF